MRGEKVHHLGWCPDCGKVRYSDRRMARATARRIHHGESLRAYRCGDYWHIGNPRKGGAS